MSLNSHQLRDLKINEPNNLRILPPIAQFKGSYIDQNPISAREINHNTSSYPTVSVRQSFQLTPTTCCTLLPEAFKSRLLKSKVQSNSCLKFSSPEISSNKKGILLRNVESLPNRVLTEGSEKITTKLIPVFNGYKDHENAIIKEDNAKSIKKTMDYNTNNFFSDSPAKKKKVTFKTELKSVHSIQNDLDQLEDSIMQSNNNPKPDEEISSYEALLLQKRKIQKQSLIESDDYKMAAHFQHLSLQNPTKEVLKLQKSLISPLSFRKKRYHPKNSELFQLDDLKCGTKSISIPFDGKKFYDLQQFSTSRENSNMSNLSKLKAGLSHPKDFFGALLF